MVIYLVPHRLFIQNGTQTWQVLHPNPSNTPLKVVEYLLIFDLKTEIFSLTFYKVRNIQANLAGVVRR
jgi:hypothetical protein